MQSDPLRLAFLGDSRSVHVRRWIAWFTSRGHRADLLDGIGSAPPDVLHAHYVRRYGWAAARSGFHPYVVSPWGSDLLKTRAWNVRTRYWNWRALHGADLVTVTAQHMRRAAIAAGAREERIEIVQHGVDTAAFTPGDPDEALRDELQATDRPIVFSPRAIRPLYRHETVIEALARAETDAILVMTAANADPAYRAEIERQVSDIGLADRVRIVDAIPHERMVDYLRLADVVISVPESDSFPVTLLEAMATGTGIVASDLPPAREVLHDLAPEALVPVGDVPATASALKGALARSQGQRETLGRRMREWVVANADYDTNMRKMEGLYRRLAGREAVEP